MMNIPESAGESSCKRQENGDGSTGSERPLKKARFAWQVKGKYHLKNDPTEVKPSTGLPDDTDSAGSSKQPETESSLVGNTEQNLEILGDYLLKQDFNTLDSVITDSDKTLLKPSTSVPSEKLEYPIYIRSCDRSNSRTSSSSRTEEMSIPMSMVVTHNYSEDQCIARWQARQQTRYELVDDLITRGFNPVLQWVPSHIGLLGNEKADLLAKRAISDGRPVDILPNHFEILPKFKKKCYEMWTESFNEICKDKGIWYKSIQNLPPRIPWFTCAKMGRKLIVIAHRLRSGHMPLRKFAFLMKKADSPNCEECNVVEDVYHLLMECVKFNQARDSLMRELRLNKFNMAKGFVDNTINRVLDSWFVTAFPTQRDDQTLALDVAELINNFPGGNSIENEGILMAISAHGLQNTSRSSNNSQNEDLPDSNELFPSIQATNKNDFDSPIQSDDEEANDGVESSRNKNDDDFNDLQMSWSYDEVKEDAQQFSFFPDASSSSYLQYSDNDHHQSSNVELEKDQNISLSGNDNFTDHFDFMDAAVSFAIQNKGLTSFGSDYG